MSHHINIVSTAGPIVSGLAVVGGAMVILCLLILLARWAFPPERRECGCGVVIDHQNWDSEVVETQERWVRDERGAKVIWPNLACGSHR